MALPAAAVAELAALVAEPAAAVADEADALADVADAVALVALAVAELADAVAEALAELALAAAFARTLHVPRPPRGAQARARGSMTLRTASMSRHTSRRWRASTSKTGTQPKRKQRHW